MLSDYDKVYDTIARVLTDYEGNGAEGLEGDPEPLYELLVDIQNLIDDGYIECKDEERWKDAFRQRKEL